MADGTGVDGGGPTGGLPPVLEQAELRIRPGQEQQFEQALQQAAGLIAAADGFRGMSVSRGVEQPGTYLLLVGWDSVEAHEQGFRGSADYDR